MPRYIDAEMLEQVLEKNFGNLGGAGVLVQLIQAQPAADVEEIKHGQWIDGRCSVCGVPKAQDKRIDELEDDRDHWKARCEAAERERDAANARNISKGVTMLVASDDEQPFEYEHYVCPGCKNIITQRLKGSKETLWKPRYCRDCGQALDWSGPCAEHGGADHA